MALRTASFRATCTIGLEKDTGSVYSKVYEDDYKVVLNYTNSEEDVRCLYSWDFGLINTDYSALLTEINSSTITSIQVSFAYNSNQDANTLTVFYYSGTTEACDTSVSGIPGRITAFDLGDVDVSLSGRNSATVDLTNKTVSFSTMFYDQVATRISAPSTVTLTIVRHSDNDSYAGQIELGGLTLIEDIGEWRAASGDEITSPPLLLITYELEESEHPTVEMRYTTEDPTTSQSTPENSIGGYLSSNTIYSYGDIASSVSSIQTTVPIDDDSSLPSDTGLASVGPEILRFDYIDSSSHLLSQIERGIAPGVGFPAGFDAFKIPEKVYYLDIDNLFNTRPTSGLVQYRCIAITNTDTNQNFSIRDVYVSVLQNPLLDVQVAIGVEVPKFDNHTGLSESGTTTTLLIDSDFNSFSSGYFNGAYVTFPSLSGTAIVSSFADGQFVLDRTVTGLTSGKGFSINPYKSQIVANDSTAPTDNNGRFSGFATDVAPIAVELQEHGLTMQEGDLFYVWIRRTLQSNKKPSHNTGAVIVFQFRDN